MTKNRGPAEKYLATLLVHNPALRHCPHPRLDSAADHFRTLVVDSTGRFHVRLQGCKHMGLENKAHTQEPVSARAGGSPFAVHMRPSVHTPCNGRQRIRNWDQCPHGGRGPPLMPGESDFLYHHQIAHRIRLAPKGYIEDNRVLGGRSMVDCTQA